jgi:hypothetical protein
MITSLILSKITVYGLTSLSVARYGTSRVYSKDVYRITFSYVTFLAFWVTCKCFTNHSNNGIKRIIRILLLIQCGTGSDLLRWMGESHDSTTNLIIRWGNRRRRRQMRVISQDLNRKAQIYLCLKFIVNFYYDVDDYWNSIKRIWIESNRYKEQMKIKVKELKLNRRNSKLTDCFMQNQFHCMISWNSFQLHLKSKKELTSELIGDE